MPIDSILSLLTNPKHAVLQRFAVGYPRTAKAPLVIAR
jgi:hypothetical protein